MPDGERVPLRRRRREFLDFMNAVVAQYGPDTELHVILDNLSTHKPRRERWLKRHPNVHFHYTPTRASWLNQIDTWFSKLSRAALRRGRRGPTSSGRAGWLLATVARGWSWPSSTAWNAKPRTTIADRFGRFSDGGTLADCLAIFARQTPGRPSRPSHRDTTSFAVLRMLQSYRYA